MTRWVILFTIVVWPLNLRADLRKWNVKMQQMRSGLQEIMPLLVEDGPVSSAKQKRLEKATQKLMTLAHQINYSPDAGVSPLPPDGDPTLPFVATLLDRELKHAYESLRESHVDYAKHLLRTATGYCITCHTRNDRGPDFPVMDWVPPKGVGQLEKAELLTATRHFDEALDAYRAVLQDSKRTVQRPIEWGKALRAALVIAVRVKQDPDKALAVIDAAQKQTKAPDFYQAYLPVWKKSIEEWKAGIDRKPSTEDAIYAEAKTLMDRAKEAQKYPLDHTTEILYLRASASAHELLGRFPSGKRAAEALFIAGVVYDTWSDRQLVSLPEMYFEACIRKAPGTPIARDCFGRFEERVYFGFTGSSGTVLPKDRQDLLQELKTLATGKASAS